MGGANTRLTILNPGNPTGLKFSVEHGEARCLFDFGLQHAPGRAPFSLGLAPRLGRELEDLQAVGSAPALDGVYARDGWDGRTEVFISHLHLDHTSLVRFLHPDVPLHYPAGMEELRQAAETSGYLPWRSPAGAGVADRQSVRVGEIEVRFVAVDHDLPGASGFLVTTPDLSIAYTGDLRRHGLHPEVTDALDRKSTPELQSPCNLVCRLLLEKKKKINQYQVVEVKVNPIFRPIYRVLASILARR